MSQGPNTINTFIRGGQYLAHLGQMIVQNIARGLAVCLVIAFMIGSYFYIKKLDGYDKYIMSIEFSNLAKASLPVGRDQYNNHFIDIYSPDGPTQQYARVLMKERRLVPWFEYERKKTMKKLKAAIWLTAIDSLIMLLFLSAISQTLGRIITRDKQTRGARLVSKRELIREVRTFNKSEKKKTKMEHYVPYEIEGVEYALRSETQHTLLAGSTGVGKTQLLLRLMQQVHDRNDRAVIYDKMRSFVPMFYNPETDHILNPLDDRCPPWDIFSDARNIVEWTSISEAIIQGESDDPFWTHGAKAIFANTASRLQEQCRQMGTIPTLTDLLYLLTQTSVEELHKFLKGTEAARMINPTSDKQAASMLATLSQSITPLGFLKDSTAENPGFSIRRWMADDTLKGKLFLTSRDDQHDTLQPLLTMWMSLCTTSLMSQERSNDRLCWFFIDELPSLNKLPSLENGLAQARQYGGAFVLGIQLESQLQETYEVKGAQTIMGLTLNKAIFNPGDPQTAKSMADAIGKTEIIRRNEGISLGAKRIRDGVNMNSQITQEHIVLPEELMSLPNLTFYLRLRGNLPCAILELKYIPIDNVHEGFIEDMNFMNRFNYKMSNPSSADAAKRIITTIRQQKSPAPEYDKPSIGSIQTTENPPVSDRLPQTATMSGLTVINAAEQGAHTPQSPNTVMPPLQDNNLDEEFSEGSAPSTDFINSMIGDNFDEDISDDKDVPASAPIYNDSQSIQEPTFEQEESVAADTNPNTGNKKRKFSVMNINPNMWDDEDEEPPTDSSGDRSKLEKEKKPSSPISQNSTKSSDKDNTLGADENKDKAKNAKELLKRVHQAQSKEGGIEVPEGRPVGAFGQHKDDRGR